MGTQGGVMNSGTQVIEQRAPIESSAMRPLSIRTPPLSDSAIFREDSHSSEGRSNPFAVRFVDPWLIGDDQLIQGLHA